jgi:transcriptional regulator with XRE-family HTH domain
MSEQRAASPARERHWVYAQRLRERRLALGLTQREVVDRLQRIGNRTTNRALSAMENGRGLDLGLLPELAEVLGCTTTYLLGLTSDPLAWQPGGGHTRRPDAAARPADDRAVSLPGRPGGVLGANVPRGFAAPVGERRRPGEN